MMAGVGHSHDMDTGGSPDCGLCAAVDVHYLSTDDARTAAVVAADAAFAHLLAERIAVGPGYRPTSPMSSAGVSSRRCARSWTV
jgi:hypothetical protein